MLDHYERQALCPPPQSLLVGEPNLLRFFHGLPPHPRSIIDARMRMQRILFVLALTMFVQLSPRVFDAWPLPRSYPPWPPLIPVARKGVLYWDRTTASVVPAGIPVSPIRPWPVFGTTRMRPRRDRDIRSRHTPRLGLAGAPPNATFPSVDLPAVNARQGVDRGRFWRTQ